MVAPLFWYAAAGLPGLFAYKAVNTLDSMIGHRTERYRHFGAAAARLDDVVNWLPARLAGLYFVAAAWMGDGRAGLGAGDIRRSLHLYITAGALVALTLALLWWLI